MTRNMQSYENLQHRIYEGVGEYGTPLLEPTEFEKCEFIGFNYCRTCKDKEGKGVHFFLDDYQFNRIWNQPNKYDLTAVPVCNDTGFLHVYGFSENHSNLQPLPKTLDRSVFTGKWSGCNTNDKLEHTG